MLAQVYTALVPGGVLILGHEPMVTPAACPGALWRRPFHRSSTIVQDLFGQVRDTFDWVEHLDLGGQECQRRSIHRPSVLVAAGKSTLRGRHV